MDEDMQFPNPVLRTDLPLKKPRWPKVLTALAAVAVLVVLLLPQIAGSKLGKPLVRTFLGSKFNGEVSCGDFHTSWFGRSSIRQVTIRMADGHVMAANSIACDASLWKLLRGRYDLGDAVFDGLILDYVSDYGDGATPDSFAQVLKGKPRAPGTWATLPRLSGKIRVVNGTLSWYRGHVEPDSLRTVFDSAKFTAINGNIDIPAALDQPWSYNLAGNLGDDARQDGRISSSGTVTLGAAGQMLPEAIRVDARIEGSAVPMGVLGPLLSPTWSGADYARIFGRAMQKASIALRAADGRLEFVPVEASGAEGMGADLHLVIDLRALLGQPLSSPAPNAGVRVTVEGGAAANGAAIANTISGALTPALAREQLSLLNPFLRGATGEGSFTLRVESMALPLGVKNWNKLALRGQLSLRGARLAGRGAPLADAGPDIVTQLALLTSDVDISPLPEPMEIRFTVQDGNVQVEPYRMMVGDVELSIGGSVGVDGSNLRMTATLLNAAKLLSNVPGGSTTGGAAKGTLVFPITGSATDPHLDMDSIRATEGAALIDQFNAFLKKQLAALAARDAERAERVKDKQVKEQMRLFGPAGQQ